MCFMSGRIWHKGNVKFLGNPGGIYAPNKHGKIVHDPKAKAKPKNLGKAFQLIKDLEVYRNILNDLRQIPFPTVKQMNEKYGLNGSFNFYYDLKSNNIEQYKKWYF